MLERFTQTHIALPVSIFLLTGDVSLYYGLTRNLLTGLSAFGLFLTGLAGFTLVEYLAHRFLYHLPPTTPARARLQYILHGVHHEFSEG